MNGPGVKPSFTEQSTRREREMATIRQHAVPVELLQGEPPKRKGDWVLTATGRAYWPLDPRAEDVSIADIAHSLAMQCRYGGHCRLFYSVAEHSVWMSHLILEGPQNTNADPDLALIALLHDATEAYVSDVPRPLKPHLANYEAIERKNWLVICDAFGLPRIAPPPEVQDLDCRMCLREMGALMPKNPMPLGIEGPTPDFDPQCWSPAEAEAKFLSRFDQLWGQRMACRYPAAYYKKGA